MFGTNSFSDLVLSRLLLFVLWDILCYEVGFIFLFYVCLRRGNHGLSLAVEWKISVVCVRVGEKKTR